jgi:hypothetical protein
MLLFREGSMTDAPQFVTMRNAFEDLQRRTLSQIPCDFARLIYLASMRDYNSAIYHHEGLAARYGQEQARDALQASHRDIFRRLVSLPLEKLVTELEAYVEASHEAPDGFIHAWQELEPYRVAVPMEADSSMVQLFLSNIRLALEVLRFRQEQGPACQPTSSPLPLPDR